MTETWDYTALAASYGKRPAYAQGGIDWLLATADVRRGARVCDIGAGTGHLTEPLLDRGLIVDAIEPNDAMRFFGIERTAGRGEVAWFKAKAEHTDRPAAHYDLVTFGSSFNVVDRAAALLETDRLLKPGGWMACLWNHRDLDDPLQAEVEALITSHIPGYDYGVRREDQTSAINDSGLFGSVERVEARVVHRVDVNDWIEAWRSHATLARQAGDRHGAVVEAIAKALTRMGLSRIDIPYLTRVWAARRKN